LNLGSREHWVLKQIDGRWTRIMANVYRQLSLQTLILRFAPAIGVPAFLSIFSIYILSRILEPKALGEYNLTLTVILIVQSILFFPLDMALSRFHAIKDLDNSTETLFRTVYMIALSLNAGLIALAGVIFFCVGPAQLDAVFGDMWLLALPLLVMRTIVGVNQSIVRVSGDLLRFNIIECLCPSLGLGLGLILIWQFHEDNGAMTGLFIGLLAGAILDLRTPFRLFLKRSSADRHIAAEIMKFVWPVMLGSLVACGLQYADRFLVDAYSGPAAVAVYVIAFSLVDRPLTMVCMLITAGAFQKAMDAYAADGLEMARKQLGHNGALLLAIVGPACVGLMLSAHSIAAVMVGPAIRDGLAPLIQIMAVTSLLRAMGTHYADHTFHIPNKPFILLAIYGPAAIINIFLCFIFVPRYGMIAAAYCGLVSQIGSMLVNWAIARRILPLWLPKTQVFMILMALSLMACVLVLIPVEPGWNGLAIQICIGMTVYFSVAFMLDLGGLRTVLFRKSHLYFTKPTIAE